MLSDLKRDMKQYVWLCTRPLAYAVTLPHLERPPEGACICTLGNSHHP